MSCEQAVNPLNHTHSVPACTALLRRASWSCLSPGTELYAPGCPQIPALEAAGYRVLAPSLPGFGDSDRPQELAAYSLPSLARCMLGLLDQLGVAKVGGCAMLAVPGGQQLVAQFSQMLGAHTDNIPGCWLQAHVVGHDWGASLAWYLAMKAPQRVERLVALSVGHAGKSRPSLPLVPACRQAQCIHASLFCSCCCQLGPGPGCRWRVQARCLPAGDCGSAKPPGTCCGS